MCRGVRSVPVARGRIGVACACRAALLFVGAFRRRGRGCRAVGARDVPVGWLCPPKAIPAQGPRCALRAGCRDGVRWLLVGLGWAASRQRSTTLSLPSPSGSLEAVGWGGSFPRWSVFPLGASPSPNDRVLGARNGWFPPAYGRPPAVRAATTCCCVLRCPTSSRGGERHADTSGRCRYDAGTAHPAGRRTPGKRSAA